MPYGAPVNTSDWIAAGSLAVAFGSLGVAVVQTGKANTRSREANATADNALRVAREAGVDAAKGRLAEGLPDILVRPGVVDWPPLRRPDWLPANGVAYEPSRVFRQTEDDNTQIGLRFSFTVTNRGAAADIIVNGPFAPDSEHWSLGPAVGKKIHLAAGEERTFVMEGYEPLTRWIQQHDEREAGGAGSVDLTASVGYANANDEGVIATVSVRTACIGLQRVDGQNSAWRLPNPNAITPHDQWPPTQVEVRPAEVTYWRSKSGGVRLETGA